MQSVIKTEAEKILWFWDAFARVNENRQCQKSKLSCFVGLLFYKSDKFKPLAGFRPFKADVVTAPAPFISSGPCNRTINNLMAQSARASDRWCWHIYLMMWCYFLCHFFFSSQILRRADKNGKYCQRAASTHSQTQPQALSRVQKQMHFFNEILIRTVSFFFLVCFHGNRKMAMPIEVWFHDINEVKHRKLAAVRHFCPVASHLQVWVAKVQREICCYLSCMVQIRITCSTSLQNAALNWSHRSV